MDIRVLDIPGIHQLRARVHHPEQILDIHHIQHKIVCRCQDRREFIHLRNPVDIILVTVLLDIRRILQINSIRDTRIILIKLVITTRTLIIQESEIQLLDQLWLEQRALVSSDLLL